MRSKRSDIPASNGYGTGVPTSPAQAAEPDLPPLSEQDQAALAALHARQQVLRDLTLACLAGNFTGLFVHGPPGVSKSYTIRNTLREEKAYWQHHQRITAKPLYHALEKHPGAIHVVDDCEQLFSEKSALTLLRAALGGERMNGRRERRVSYSISGSRARELSHYFYGAIIFTANRELAHEKPEVAAVMSRIPCVGFAPPDHEIRALMRFVARQGFIGEGGQLTPHECVEVVEHVIQMAAELEVRLDLRWVEHGYGYFLTDVARAEATDWRDLLRFHLMRSLTYFEHTPPAPAGHSKHSEASRRDAIAREISIAREIAEMPGLSRDERLQLWERRTKLSRPTYYRRLKTGRTNPVDE